MQRLPRQITTERRRLLEEHFYVKEEFGIWLATTKTTKTTNAFQWRFAASLARAKKSKMALNIKVWKFYMHLILICKFLWWPWSSQAKFKFWPKVSTKIRKFPIAVTHIMALCCKLWLLFLPFFATNYQGKSEKFVRSKLTPSRP